MPKLTREQAAVISAYTGFLAGPFEDLQALGDKLMGYPTFTHQYGDLQFTAELRDKAKSMFVAICADR